MEIRHDRGITPFRLNQVLPGRRFALSLREQLVAYLSTHRPPPGTPLLSEAELVELAQVSRSTVRRSLDPLEAEGWIERRQGKGTFVGPRAALGDPRGVGEAIGRAPTAAPVLSADGQVIPARPLARLAVLTDRAGDWQHDWYAQGIVRGLDHAADDLSLSIELMGYSGLTRPALVRRLEQSRPDVLAILTPTLAQIMIAGVADRMGVSVIGSGAAVEELGFPAVNNDDVADTAAIVDYLVERGHRRIMAGINAWAKAYIFRCREGYAQGLARHGIEYDQNLEFWCDPLPKGETAEAQMYDLREAPHAQAAVLEALIRKSKPTALIATDSSIVAALGVLVRAGRIRVPEDLSLVAVGQFHSQYSLWLGGIVPDLLVVPLEKFGHRLAEISRDIVDRKSVPSISMFACKVEAGQTVRTIN